jgi:hypothetical protein
LDNHRGTSAPDGGFLARVKAIMLLHVSHVQGLMQLLMKPRNGMPWSAEDKAALRSHLTLLAKALPAFGIFSLPGGMLLLPLLAAFLDRRKRRRNVRPVDTTEKESEMPQELKRQPCCGVRKS